MWTRRELKEKGKFAFKRNYWKTVLVAILFTLVAGGMGSAGGSSFGSGVSDGMQSANSVYEAEGDDVMDGVDDYYDGDDLEDNEATPEEWMQGLINGEIEDPSKFTQENIIAMAVAGVVIFVMALIFIAIVLVIDVFVANPLEVGIRRFFTQNLNQAAGVKEITYAFDSNYKNIAKTMFYRDLYTFLWSLLFIIPGIVKAYEYRMIPYLLAENPQMSKEDAFAASKQMMDGQKWRTFVLDLSFFGWILLSGLTCGILSIFYVNPYMFSTEAALYERLRYGNVQGSDENVVEVQGTNC